MDGDALAPPTKSVTFSLQPAVVSVDQRLGMATVLIESLTGLEITDAILEEASRLFSENYGIWGKGSRHPGWQQAHYSLPLLTFCREAGQAQWATTESTMAA